MTDDDDELPWEATPFLPDDGDNAAQALLGASFRAPDAKTRELDRQGFVKDLRTVRELLETP